MNTNQAAPAASPGKFCALTPVAILILWLGVNTLAILEDTEGVLFANAVLLALAVAYLAGVFHGQCAPDRWGQFYTRCAASLTWNQLIASIAVPLGWLVLFYLFVAHVRLDLGRWPAFGESLDGWLIRMHQQVLVNWGMGMLFSLVAIPPVFVIGLIYFRRLLRLWIGLLIYGIAVLVAFGAVFGSPEPFLNWLLD